MLISIQLREKKGLLYTIVEVCLFLWCNNNKGIVKQGCPLCLNFMEIYSSPDFFSLTVRIIVLPVLACHKYQINLIGYNWDSFLAVIKSDKYTGRISLTGTGRAKCFCRQPKLPDYSFSWEAPCAVHNGTAHSAGRPLSWPVLTWGSLGMESQTPETDWNKTYWTYISFCVADNYDYANWTK